MNKTEWLSLELHSQKVSDLVSDLMSAECSELQLVLALESEVTSMKIMTSLLLSQICSSPIEQRKQEVLS